MDPVPQYETNQGLLCICAMVGSSPGVIVGSCPFVSNERSRSCWNHVAHMLPVVLDMFSGRDDHVQLDCERAGRRGGVSWIRETEADQKLAALTGFDHRSDDVRRSLVGKSL